MSNSFKEPNLFSAITIGVGSIIGSGWLFACYYAAKFAGPSSILSWIIGAFIALILALLLAEVATMYQERGLLSRLLTITHNKDYGFIVAVSNWFAMIVLIPSEAEATVQYFSTFHPYLNRHLFVNGLLTKAGIAIVCLLIVVYGIINYWGIKSLAKTNNLISSIKLFIPGFTSLIIILTAFHPGNFTIYKNTFAPYGITNAFTAVVNCGIFYAFYGFSLITIFAKELKNPQKNIPIALVGSVLICLAIYLSLQISFIGAINPSTATNGWHLLNFTSPLAQLAGLLGLNWLAILLYCDATISPSGTAIIYVGSGTRMLSAMAEDKQFPSIFANLHPKHQISRSSLIFTILLCFSLVAFFDNWQKIMVVVTVFQLIACLAIPLAFTKLRLSKPKENRLFYMPLGKTSAFLAFVAITYLLAQTGFKAILFSLLLHVVFFIIYCNAQYKFRAKLTWYAFKSSWSMFAYLAILAIMGYAHDINILEKLSVFPIFLIFALISYKLLVNQNSYTLEN